LQDVAEEKLGNRKSTLYNWLLVSGGDVKNNKNEEFQALKQQEIHY
jgi:hypothetical protein